MNEFYYTFSRNAMKRIIIIKINFACKDLQS